MITKIFITKFIFLLYLFNSYCYCKTILLKPSQADGEDIAIILLQGTFISNDKYLLLAKEIQRSISTKRVWVSLPEAFLDMPYNIAAYKAVNDALADLKKNEFPENGKKYLAGHSLGGYSASEYGYEKDNRFAGLILLASTLQRSKRSVPRTTNVLVIGGELDGLMRITRMTEEFYHNCYDNTQRKAIVNNSPVVVIRAINHISFSNGEVPSNFVKKRDLKAEISVEEAHSKIASVINAFINNNSTLLASHLNDTLSLVNPIITAFEMEGSVHFNRPDQNTCSRGYCGKGSEWAKRAQWIISRGEQLEKEGYKIHVDNDFVELDSLPPFKDLHHPKIVVDPINHPQQINFTTFSQNSWKLFDKYFDGGIDFISSNEIGSKFMSRQCSFIVGANKSRDDYPFNVDTDYDLCAEVNINAYNWTKSIVSNISLERFEKYGQKFKFVKDDVKNNGFSFTYFLLHFNENEKTGEIEVSSPAMMTSIDVPPIPIFAPEGANCFHYCKLLSPARALEWIYVDGLRKNYGV